MNENHRTDLQDMTVAVLRHDWKGAIAVAMRSGVNTNEAAAIVEGMAHLCHTIDRQDTDTP